MTKKIRVRNVSANYPEDERFIEEHCNHAVIGFNPNEGTIGILVDIMGRSHFAEYSFDLADLLRVIGEVVKEGIEEEEDDDDYNY